MRRDQCSHSCVTYYGDFSRHGISKTQILAYNENKNDKKRNENNSLAVFLFDVSHRGKGAYPLTFIRLPRRGGRLADATRLGAAGGGGRSRLIRAVSSKRQLQPTQRAFFFFNESVPEDKRIPWGLKPPRFFNVIL